MSEYTWLKDTDNTQLTEKISNLIDNQLPEFIKSEGTNFAESQLKQTSRDEVIGWIMGKKI